MRPGALPPTSGTDEGLFMRLESVSYWILGESGADNVLPAKAGVRPAMFPT